MGENLLRNDLLLKSLEILYGDNRPDAPPPKLDVRLTTNGYYLTEDLVKNPLFQRINQVEISVASTLSKEKYEAIYEINYDVVKQNVMNLKNYFQNKVIIAYVRVKQLVEEETEFKKFWTPYVDNFLAHDFHNSGGAFEQSPLSVRQYTEEYRKFSSCGIFYFFVFISSEGNILPCCNDVQSKHPIGNVGEETIKSIIEKKREIQKRSTKGYDICKGCDGGDLMFMDNIPDDEKPQFDICDTCTDKCEVDLDSFVPTLLNNKILLDKHNNK